MVSLGLDALGPSTALDDPTLTPPGQVASGERVIQNQREKKDAGGRGRIGEWAKEDKLFGEEVTDQMSPTSTYQSEARHVTTLTSKTPKR